MYLRCTSDGCTNNIPIKNKWDRIRACNSEHGWFESKDGKIVYCPKHLPEWLINWRKRKATL